MGPHIGAWLGLGTARESGLVQSFDDMSLWSQIGYRRIDGQFSEGEMVALERSPDSYPEYFKERIKPEEAVSSHVFHDVHEQARWIAGNVKINLEEDELDPDDILIVLPSAISSKRDAQVILDALWQQGINGHLVGVGNSQDEMFRHDSVAIAHIYRSKGNEAPMVYVANAQVLRSRPWADHAPQHTIHRNHTVKSVGEDMRVGPEHVGVRSRNKNDNK